MAKKDVGICWFINYSFRIDDVVHEASVYFIELASEHFQYNRMKDHIQAWLNKIHEGDLNVVIRNYFKVPHEEGQEFWSNKPNESWMIKDITK